MARTVKTSEGDRLDQICYAVYGVCQGAVEQVLQANPGLAARGQPYPYGILITIPDIAVQPPPTVKLWT